MLRYLHERVPGGAEFAPGILCGTSVGAIHAAFVAATADRPREQGRMLSEIWSSLRLEDVFHLGLRELATAWRRMSGGGSPAQDAAPAGLVDATPFQELVRSRVDWARLRANVDGGLVRAVSVSATQVATGRTMVFVDRTGGGLPNWSRDPHVAVREAKIGPAHALASAAIPFVFPPVKVENQWFCDGSLRQNTPLSPALRLGATRVLVIGVRHRSESTPDAQIASARLSEFPTPLFLAGKVLNALLLDRIDYDLARLEGFNAMIDGLETAFGPDAPARLAEVMGRSRGAPYRKVRAFHVRPSKDIGVLAAEYASGPQFAERAKGLSARLARRLARRDASREADFLSYFLFDGGFARRLLDLGYTDAQAKHTEMAEFVDPR